VEAEAERPFVGPAGQALREMMHAAGIDPAQVRLFNVIPYRPIGAGRRRRASQPCAHTRRDRPFRGLPAARYRAEQARRDRRPRQIGAGGLRHPLVD
jgi:hypothetical protein